jgi:hypothetical protein
VLVKFTAPLLLMLAARPLLMLASVNESNWLCAATGNADIRHNADANQTARNRRPVSVGLLKSPDTISPSPAQRVPPRRCHFFCCRTLRGGDAAVLMRGGWRSDFFLTFASHVLHGEYF